MNQTIETFSRETLKEKLALCTSAQQLFFKRMYSHKNLEADINDVVDRMPTDKISWALTQVEKTLEKNNANIQHP